MSEESQPDLTGAEVYVEDTDQPVAGGRWYVLTDGSVLYQQPYGTFQPAIICVDTLRSAGWKRAPEPEQS